MNPRIRRQNLVPRVLSVIFVALLAAATAVLLPGYTSAEGETALTAEDGDLLVRVKLAGLWEGPAGAMAVAKGVDFRVRQAGQVIMAQHHQLDRLVEDAASRLGLILPQQPNPEQSQWLAEMSQAQGDDFDRVFVDRLRRAHAKVLPVVAAVRATTANATVRELAAQADLYVLNHLNVLDQTGLSGPAIAAAAARAPARAAGGSIQPRGLISQTQAAGLTAQATASTTTSASAGGWLSTGALLALAPVLAALFVLLGPVSGQLPSAGFPRTWGAR